MRIDSHLPGNWLRTDRARLPGEGPLYRRLAGAIRDAVCRGEAGAGSRLPSERDLARSMGLSRTTVVAAYRLLREEGLLESVRGSGTRVAVHRSAGPAVPAADMPALKLPERPPDGVVDCQSSVVPDLGGVPDEILNVTAGDLRATAADADYEPLGLPVLRAAVADHYTRLGLPTTAEQVLVTNGAQQAISLLFTLFSRGQGVIVSENPTYTGALDSARAAGARIVGLPVDEEGVKAGALRAALGRTRVQLLYLMTAGQNPTGAAMSTERRHDVARLVAAAGVPVVDDMTLADLAFDGRSSGPFAATAVGATVVTVGSLSKLFWPGLRVGWVRAPEQLIARLARLKVVADLGSSHVGQLIAVRLLPRIAEMAATRREQLAVRRDLLSGLLHAELPDWSWTRPRGGAFLWVRLPYGDAEEFARLALAHGVLVLPGSRTSTDGSFADHLRISYVAEPAELRLAAQRLSRAWAAQGRGSSAPGLSA
ncbi:PLP-dependent aminotransferase family protein [Microtetraspora malaysiensis]|uniref:aminotransferase-like domain-containing protein n=1 Tax=Microtetraspora malaysiensis TaxID=161358 RepID=UPI003D8E61AE